MSGPKESRVKVTGGLGDIFFSAKLSRADVYSLTGGKKTLRNLISDIQSSESISNFVEQKGLKETTDDKLRLHLYEQGKRAMYLYGRKQQNSMLEIAQASLDLSLAEPVEPENPEAIHFPFLADSNEFRMAYEGSSVITEQPIQALNTTKELIENETAVLFFEDIVNLQEERKIRKRPEERRVEKFKPVIHHLAVRKVMGDITHIIRRDEDSAPLKWAGIVLRAAERLPKETREIETPQEEGIVAKEPKTMTLPSLREEVLYSFRERLVDLAVKKAETVALMADELVKNYRLENPGNLDLLILRFTQLAPSSPESLIYLTEFLETGGEATLLEVVNILTERNARLIQGIHNQEELGDTRGIENIFEGLINHSSRAVRGEAIYSLRLWHINHRDHTEDLVTKLLQATITYGELSTLFESIENIMLNLDQDFIEGESKKPNRELTEFVNRIGSGLLSNTTKLIKRVLAKV